MVPRWRRAEWLAEWKSELWYILQRCDLMPRRSWLDRDAVLFCLGAFSDAMWMRCDRSSPKFRQHLWPESPLRCLLFLATLTGLAVSYFFRPFGPIHTMVWTKCPGRGLLIGNLLMIVIAFLVLPVTTSFSLGELPVTRSVDWAKRLWRAMFLGSKTALVLALVFCGTFDLARLLNPTGFQPQLTLVAYLWGLRWALIDQRGRCPVCLRLVANPARIGQPCQTLLGRYGTEYFCAKGHGRLYVPEVPTTYTAQRWLDPECF
jgi:hypothetical protein